MGRNIGKLGILPKMVGKIIKIELGKMNLCEKMVGKIVLPHFILPFHSIFELVRKKSDR